MKGMKSYHKKNLSSKFVEEKYINIIENIILIVLTGEIEMTDIFFKILFMKL